MSVSIRLDDRNFQRFIKKLPKEAMRLAIRPLYRAADMIRGISQDRYLRGQSLTPRTHTLINSVRAFVNTHSRYPIAGVRARAVSARGFDYASYWEWDGSAHGGPREYLQPARDDHQREWLTEFERAFEQEFNAWASGNRF